MNGIQLLLVIVGAIAVTAIAHRRGLQPALVVVVLAAAVSFVPGLPRFELEPELILGVVVPPLLYATALDFSFVSFRRNLRPILSLGVGMVVVSTFVTGLVASWVVPGMALGSALVLGAVVAPPDAVTALAIGRKLGLPRKLTAILTGESLVNDAAALTIFTVTVAAVAGTPTAIGNPLLLFVYGAGVGIALGVVLGLVVHRIRLRLRDSGLETALNVLVPFVAYLAAEELHASGVLAVVTAGFVIGHNDSDASFDTRMQARDFWKTTGVLLEAFVFAYMGLQCRFVFEDVLESGTPIGTFVFGSLLILLTVLLVRPLWIFLTYGQTRLRAWLRNRLPESRRRTRFEEPMPWRYTTVISWTGMRGVITLAAAAGTPLLTQNGAPFPGRDLIQAIAFVVTVGTILLQGLTLPPLIRALRIAAPEEQLEFDRAKQRAREISASAARQALGDALRRPPQGVDPDTVQRFAEKIKASIAARRRELDSSTSDIRVGGEQIRETARVLRAKVLATQRAALINARDSGELDDEVLRLELERLDYEEAAAAHDGEPS